MTVLAPEFADGFDDVDYERDVRELDPDEPPDAVAGQDARRRRP